MKKSKRYLEVSKMVDRTKIYDINEGLKLLSETAKAKFDETVELHIKLGVDGRNADQQVRGTVVLPNGTGRTVRVLVIAKGDAAIEAEKSGADYVGAEEMVAKIQQGWLDFDVCITTSDMMGVVGRIARILGPRGLMPNPKSGTVVKGAAEIAKPIKDAKAGKVEYRLDKTNIVHLPIGKVSFGEEKLLENYNTVMAAIVKAKPAAAKGTYLKSISIASSMGPGIKVNYNV